MDSSSDPHPALAKLHSRVQRRVLMEQNGIPNFFDNLVKTLCSLLGENRADQDWRRGIKRSAPPEHVSFLVEAVEAVSSMSAVREHSSRFVRWSDRQPKNVGREVAPLDFIASQGVGGCITWKGVPLFKTAYEVATYQMLLWELKPATVLEIGSGLGGSAMWMADQLDALGIDSHVYSIDIRSPRLFHSRVRFVEGDVRALEELAIREGLLSLPPPVLVIEDAHTNVLDVLMFAHKELLQQGDYLVVEDSQIKFDALRAFFSHTQDCYLVDTRFTDLFGRNVTSAANSVLWRAG